MNILFPQVFTAYSEIQNMKNKFPNDQEFGTEVRKYLDNLKEGKILRGHPGIELDKSETDEK